MSAEKFLKEFEASSARAGRIAFVVCAIVGAIALIVVMAP